MPTLAKILTESDLTRSRAQTGLDLGPYLDIIESVSGGSGVGGEVQLTPSESQRTEKRRLTLAAKQKGFSLTWRKSPQGVLRFVLSRAGSLPPGGRKRRRAG